MMKSLNLKYLQQFIVLSLLALLSAQVLAGKRTTTYMHTDALGSVVAASDKDGNLLWRKQYMPFGSEINRDPNLKELSYTGKKFDAELGLSYSGARYYDPSLGRFGGIDPATALENVEPNPMMFNRYAYANNNPYKFMDPDGRASVGEMIDTAAEGCGAYSCAGWALVNGLWKVFGAEGVSQVYDKGTDAGNFNMGMAAIEIVTLGQGGKVGAGVQILDKLGDAAKGAIGATKETLRLPQSLSSAVNITTRSRIKDSPFATRLAQKLSEGAQRDVDGLLSALRAGNANPGIGTRALGNGFFELRGRNAGRVIIRQTSSGSFDIIGKFQGHARGDAANSAIIQRLIKIGGG